MMEDDVGIREEVIKIDMDDFEDNEPGDLCRVLNPYELLR
jgi:hypothetical protein